MRLTQAREDGDTVAAVVVSVFIIKVSVQLFVPSIQELLEKSLPEAAVL